jgi:sulfoxide reductase heme-binding subunit YedZ
MLRSRWLKVLVFLCALTPAAMLAYRVAPAIIPGWRWWNADLGPNPLEFIEHFTGDWTIRFLVITLAITPLRRLLRQGDLIRFRRMIGLFAFFYGSLHFLAWLWFDRLFDVHEILKDVGKRPFITAGFTAFVLMLPLALTSTRGWIRRLGGKRWQALHRLVYVSGIAGVVHYYWLVKSDVRLPLFYGTLVVILLAARAIHWVLSRRVPGNTADRVRVTSY